MTQQPPRVRFAPSPTGYLHIGGVRTALFNWLWARKHGGTFVLRIEDTDQERSTPESVQVILDSMKWLGMDWDEGPEVGGPNGPYFQMQRLDTYRRYADELIEKGFAYRCYCTKEELAAAREEIKKDNPKAQFRYPGTCRDRKDRPDLPYVVRFDMSKVQREAVTYKDIVFGEITTPNKEQQDFVLLRSDGVPLYNFGVVVDDLMMGITLVMRGRDHMVNTPLQILLYEALGHTPPQFAHLPMMLSPKGEKLSKRHGAVSVAEYKNMGYTPTAVLNYLARFGWGYGDQEIFSRQELIEKFSMDHLNKSDGRFDAKKFADVAFEHLKESVLTADDEYMVRVIPFLEARGLGVIDKERLSKALPAIRPRGRTLEEAAAAMDFYFRQPPEMDEKSVTKFLTPQTAPLLQLLLDCLSEVEPFTEAAVEAAMAKLVEDQQMQMGTLAQPARVALTGRKVSPGLHEVLAVLGKQLSLDRLRAGLDLARSNIT